MAQVDDSDNQGSTADWFDQNAPTGPATGATGGNAQLRAAVAAAYQAELGRPPESDAVVDSWIAGTGGNLAAISQGLRASAEGVAYRQQATYRDPELPAPKAPDPETPNPGPPPAPPPSGTPAPIGVPTSGFGAAPAPYASDPNAPTYNPLPPYTPPLWTEGDYVPPTEADLYASPGYQARLDDRLKAGARHFASQGTILNGGTVKALDRSAQDYATSEYQTLNANKYDQYKTRYAQFADAAGRDLASRSVNAADANTTFANRTATYANGNARTLSDYVTNLTAQRNNQNDYWSRLMDLNNTGANLAGGSR